LDDEIDARRRANAISLINASDSVNLMDQSKETPLSILDDIYDDSMRHYNKKAG